MIKTCSLTLFFILNKEYNNKVFIIQNEYEGFMKENGYMDYTDFELTEIARIIKDISTDDTAELKLKLEEQLNKKFVFE